MPERILVLGSNSFSGASFIASALREGCEVVGASRSDEIHEVFLPYRWISEEKRSKNNSNTESKLFI